MTPFSLKIITPDGIKFDGQAESVVARSVDGDVTIWAHHTDFVTALGIGRAQVTFGNEKRIAACNSGVLSVLKGEVTLLASTFEWQDEIDLERANEALERTKAKLAAMQDAKEIELTRLKIQRALTRIEVKSR